ncbi:MAG: LytTR family transcriptional regulator [Acidobacteriales bacterium]|nr:LytTR family transcriptional regulator [Terriglobales bacterium]
MRGENSRHATAAPLSSIVNLDRIQEIYRDGQGEGSVILATEARLKMSRSGRQKLMESGRA